MPRGHIAGASTSDVEAIKEVKGNDGHRAWVTTETKIYRLRPTNGAPIEVAPERVKSLYPHLILVMGGGKKETAYPFWNQQSLIDKLKALSVLKPEIVCRPAGSRTKVKEALEELARLGVVEICDCNKFLDLGKLGARGGSSSGMSFANEIEEFEGGAGRSYLF